MSRIKDELVLYREIPFGELFTDMCGLIESDRKDSATAYSCANRLVEFACHYGMQGNLWHCLIAFVLAEHENAFSKGCEMKGADDSTVSAFARHDFEIFRGLMKIPFNGMFGDDISETLCAQLSDFSCREDNSKVYNKRVRDRICELAAELAAAENVDTFFDAVSGFYRDFGVGKYGLNKAFRIVHEVGEEAYLRPITLTEHVRFSDLQGYEAQKAKLIENTEAFLAGKPANNCLLFGDAGTGKSSSVKALLNEYYDKGLRMVEVYKYQFADLSLIINEVKDRNYKFIIFMDDLSFEEFEIEYKYLKAIIEGGLEKKPDNVLIYATSNRRHLIRENFKDKEERDEDMHINDTVQEKLSLVYRFGVSIYYGRPTPKEFREIVDKIAVDNHIDMPREKLYELANQWELSHGGLSGRTARQFIMHLKGTEA